MVTGRTAETFVISPGVCAFRVSGKMGWLPGSVSQSVILRDEAAAERVPGDKGGAADRLAPHFQSSSVCAGQATRGYMQGKRVQLRYL